MVTRSHVIFVAAALAAAGRGWAGGDAGQALRGFAGARARLVWCQQAAGENSDAFAQGKQLVLMGLDTDDGRGERAILSRLWNYHKPLLTPSGDRVVFSNFRSRQAFVVNWDGTGLRKVADGVAAEVWKDPATGTEWLYCITGDVTGPAFTGQPVVRCPLDRPEVQEMVWDKTGVGLDNFQLSEDGSAACGLFPWPAAGLAALPNKGWERYAKGCWTSMAPDDSRVFWVFDGLHRNVSLYRPGERRGWKVNINGAPGIGGFEVYHPRWSNDRRFMVVTGPYKVGDSKNRILGGGTDVEVYLGRFKRDLSGIEDWLRLTHNDKPDFYPDLWVEPSGVRAEAAVPEGKPAKAEAPAGPILVKARLVKTSRIPAPASIAPYRHALIVNTYEADGKRILVAQWGIRDAKVLPVAWAVGESYDLSLEPFDDHPELEGERMIMETEEYDLPMYVETVK